MVLYSSVVIATVNLITYPDDPPQKKSAYAPDPDYKAAICSNL